MKYSESAFDGLTPWPEDFSQLYLKQGYWGNLNLTQWLRQNISKRKDSLVLSGPGIDGQDQHFTGGDILREVDILARNLLALGLSRGEKAVVQMGNTNVFILVLFALFELGVIPVMALPGHGFREIKHFLELTQARIWVVGHQEGNLHYSELATQLKDAVPSLAHIIVDTDKADTNDYHLLANLLNPGHQASINFHNITEDNLLAGHQADPASIALLLCSGGTTGLPKLIPRTHRDYIYNATSSAEVCGLSNEDGYLVALPAAHNFPLACPGILGALSAGAKVVMCDSPSPDIAYEWVDKTGATVTALVPPLVRIWLQNAKLGIEAPNTLRMLQVGGSRLDTGIAKRVRKELGCNLQQVFGMAEGLLNFTRASDPEFLVNSTQGRPLSAHDEIRIVDLNGKEVPRGSRGELWTRGPYTLRGYYKDKTANNKSFSEDGYYQTGDIVRQLSTGYIIVEGRLREVIRRGAETIPAESLEAVLITHADILDAAIIGLPCERLGQQVCAVLVLEKTVTTELTLAGIRNFLIEQGVARFTLPDSIHCIEKLPLTAVGKVAHQKLIARFTVPSPSSKQEGVNLS